MRTLRRVRALSMSLTRSLTTSVAADVAGYSHLKGIGWRRGVRRRDLLAVLTCLAVEHPLAPCAQQPVRFVVGCLSIGTPSMLTAPPWVAWREALREAGFIEGHNLNIEYRWAARNDQLPALAAELVARPVDVIRAVSGVAARAAKAATSTIPIVFTGAVDPVGLGLVDDLRRPGGNITGIAGVFEGLDEKRLQLLHEVAPAATRIGYLVNPENPNPANRSDRIAPAGRVLGVEIIPLQAATPGEIEAAFASATERGIGAILIADDQFFLAQAALIVELETRYLLPIAVQSRIRGLLSYGPDFRGGAYQAGVYVARILRGERPGDLPVQQTTKFELIINLKTANALGVTVPQSLLARADEVIE